MASGALLACFLAALAGDVDSTQAVEATGVEAVPDSASPEAVALDTGDALPIATSTATPTEAATPTEPAARAAAAPADAEPVPSQPEIPPALEEAARIATEAAAAGVPIVFFGEPTATPEPGTAPDAPAGAEPEAPAAALEPAPEGPSLADSAPLLLGRVERGDGTALERLVESSGDIVEHEVNRAGTVQSCRVVGSLFGLRMVDQRPAAGGEFVHVVRDDATGALVRFAIAPDGEARAVAVVAHASR